MKKIILASGLLLSLTLCVMLNDAALEPGASAATAACASSCTVVSVHRALTEQEALFEQVFAEHLLQLKHLQQPNTKQVVLFSGTPGMGKTTIAKHLEEHCKGLRICNDDIRRILRSKKADVGLTHKYLVWCLLRLASQSPNHCIILDSGCDRLYDVHMKFIKSQGYKPFVVRLVVDKEIAKQRICQRGEDVASYLKEFDTWWAEYQAFGAAHVCDYTLDNNSSGTTQEQLAPLIKQIQEMCKGAQAPAI